MLRLFHVGPLYSSETSQYLSSPQSVEEAIDPKTLISAHFGLPGRRDELLSRHRQKLLWLESRTWNDKRARFAQLPWIDARTSFRYKPTIGSGMNLLKFRG